MNKTKAMNLKSPSSVLEILWLLIGIGVLIVAINQTVTYGIGKTYILLILSGVAFLMYLLRRSMRKRSNS